jgi:hypothetical protein
MGGQALEITRIWAPVAEPILKGVAGSVASKVGTGLLLTSPLVAAGIGAVVRSQPGYGAPERALPDTQAAAGFTAPTSSDLARQTAYANAVQLTEDQAAADRQARRQAVAQGQSDPAQEARDEYIRQASQVAADAAKARSAASRANPPVLG